MRVIADVLRTLGPEARLERVHCAKRARSSRTYTNPQTGDCFGTASTAHSRVQGHGGVSGPTDLDISAAVGRLLARRRPHQRLAAWRLEGRFRLDIGSLRGRNGASACNLVRRSWAAGAGRRKTDEIAAFDFERTSREIKDKLVILDDRIRTVATTPRDLGRSSRQSHARSSSLGEIAASPRALRRTRLVLRQNGVLCARGRHVFGLLIISHWRNRVADISPTTRFDVTTRFRRRCFTGSRGTAHRPSYAHRRRYVKHPPRAPNVILCVRERKRDGRRRFRALPRPRPLLQPRIGTLDEGSVEARVGRCRGGRIRREGGGGISRLRSAGTASTRLSVPSGTTFGSLVDIGTASLAFRARARYVAGDLDNVLTGDHVGLVRDPPRRRGIRDGPVIGCGRLRILRGSVAHAALHGGPLHSLARYAARGTRRPEARRRMNGVRRS